MRHADAEVVAPPSGRGRPRVAEATPEVDDWDATPWKPCRGSPRPSSPDLGPPHRADPHASATSTASPSAKPVAGHSAAHPRHRGAARCAPANASSPRSMVATKESTIPMTPTSTAMAAPMPSRSRIVRRGAPHDVADRQHGDRGAGQRQPPEQRRQPAGDRRVAAWMPSSRHSTARRPGGPWPRRAGGARAAPWRKTSGWTRSSTRAAGRIPAARRPSGRRGAPDPTPKRRPGSSLDPDRCGQTRCGRATPGPYRRHYGALRDDDAVGRDEGRREDGTAKVRRSADRPRCRRQQPEHRWSRGGSG